MENLGKMIRGLFERGGEVPESPNELLKEIQAWPGVLRTETQLILSSYKAGHHIKIP